MWKRKSKEIKNQSEDNTKTLSEWAELLKQLGFGSDSVPQGSLSAATYLSCMTIRCNALAKIPIKLKRIIKDSTVDDRNHPLYKVLAVRPNRFTTPHDFFWATEYERLEYGNAFWVKSIKHGVINELYLLDSRNVQIIYDNAHILSERTALYYQYTDSKLGMIIYTADEIAHFNNFAIDGIKGRPIKQYLSETIDSEKYGRNVIKNKFKDGLQDPIIVQYTGDLNHELQRKIQKKFEKLGGAQNAGKVVPIPTEFSVAQLQTNLVNNQFFEIQNLTTRQIANAFGVKSFQLNDMEKSTYSNITEQNKAFYSDTMQNVLTEYEQEIDYKLLYDSEIAKGYYTKFNADVMLRSDLKTRYEAYNIGVQGGFITIEEVRKKEDLKYMPGTDRLIIGNGASIPLTELGKQYEKGGES